MIKIGSINKSLYPTSSIEIFIMKTVTLKIDDSVNEKFLWLLEHFSKSEISILEQSDYISDEHYLRSIDGMVSSIKNARQEPDENGITPDELDW